MSTISADAFPAAQAAPGDVVTTTLHAAVEALPVAQESRDGYARTKFRHWVDADRDGCNTRKEAILEEAVAAPETGPGCSLTGGVWFSRYDSELVRDAAGLDVDHMVPLAEAWDSGASAWTAAERRSYANDLDDPRSLIAVTARSNRQKADKDPADWLPAAGYVCTYVTDWATVKTRWGLASDTREKNVLTELVSSCADVPITVTLAR
ncbi:HNH endonuclease family protein [Streptomyces clavuligerus]|uniref:HNH endonuclease family protein n=1 Tax=Streptomyces clavuligerus TaxID=1901 RepID=UPI001E3FEE05|nr:HNH endonuclease family protein [Streptomyces clavuligerus]WDN56053.1 HNH endonuclease family protein [Streptomyces clavuligerus]